MKLLENGNNLFAKLQPIHTLSDTIDLIGHSARITTIKFIRSYCSE